jgi:hypothetical protein
MCQVVRGRCTTAYKLSRAAVELIVERTRAGLEAAKRHGRVGGRRRRMTEGKVRAARKSLSAGTSPKHVAPKLGRIGANGTPVGSGLLLGDMRKAPLFLCAFRLALSTGVLI